MIGIFTDPGVGGTFLTWSVHYLRGDVSYFLVEKNVDVKLTNNPVTKKNSHNFIPNQANRSTQELQMLCQIVDCLRNAGNGIVYLHTFENTKDTKLAVNYLSDSSDKRILVSSKKYPLYHCKYQRRSAIKVGDNFTWDPDKIYDAHVKNYFLESAHAWLNADLNNIWDKREFMALNFDPFHRPHIEDYFDFDNDHHFIDILELFNVQTQIQHIFDYLNLKINSERYAHWETIYQTWQKIHYSRLLFVYYFDNIIHYILNGYSMDLSRFDLDIQQEAAIQRELIYKHNLNFKTWQLEKFTNTKQLHNLLEPNTHSINTI